MVFDLSGDDPGSVLLTIAKLRDATEACEAKYARMIRHGIANDQPTQRQLAAPGRQTTRKGANGTRAPRKAAAQKPPATEPTPSPLFADKSGE